MECSGCLEDQPNQLAHMHPGGCLYQESDSEDDIENQSVDLEPKRPSAPFIIWLNEHREGIISKYFSDNDYGYYDLGRAISKKGSELWQNLTEEDKEVYNNKYRIEYKKWKCDYRLWKNEVTKKDKLLEIEKYEREMELLSIKIERLVLKKADINLKMNSLKREINYLDENDCNYMKNVDNVVYNVDDIISGC